MPSAFSSFSLFAHRSQTPQRSFQQASAGTHATPAPNRAHSGLRGEARGDPNGNGTGGSENTIKGEFSANGVENPLSHIRGAISMARAQDMDSASSQFFICHADSTFLDGQYACFGYVTDGMDVVDAVCEAAQPTPIMDAAVALRTTSKTALTR